jgi:hypothetical protein
VGIDRAAAAVKNAGRAWWSSPARSTGRPLLAPKKNPSPPRSLDRDGERVIIKVVAGTCNHLKLLFQSVA